jgi:hypothetical protein
MPLRLEPVVLVHQQRRAAVLVQHRLGIALALSVAAVVALIPILLTQDLTTALLVVLVAADLAVKLQAFRRVVLAQAVKATQAAKVIGLLEVFLEAVVAAGQVL